MDFLRKYTIQKRLSILVALIVLSISIFDMLSLYDEYNALIESKKSASNQLVDTTFSIIEYHYALYQKGELSEEQAKEQALSIIANIRYAKSNYFWVNDYTPNMIMHPLKPKLNGKNIGSVKDPDGKALFIDIINIVEAKGEGFINYKWPKPGFDEPVNKVALVKGFTPWQWIIGTGAYLDDIDAIFVELLKLMVFEGLIIALIIIGLGFILGKSIVVPTRSAAMLMKDIAQGDGDLTNQLDSAGKDEISTLSNYFNEFTDNIRQLLLSVANNTSHVLEHAEAVSSASGTTQSLIQNQNDITAQVATAMEEMTSQIREVSDNAGSAEQAANDARNNTSDGKQIISHTINQMQSLSSNIDDVSRVVASLASES
ncbi:MAG: methyl-accepting chemotaxis protein, partial [Alteromonadales bacterium]|nr:methyl-accepting chemotaxis protein [Alteromonadales bacterium]